MRLARARLLPATEVHLPGGGQLPAIDFLTRSLAVKLRCPQSQARAAALRALANRAVFDDTGANLSASTIVGAERVWCERPLLDGPPPQLDVLHHGERCIIVNKPAAIASMPRGSYVARSAVVAARSQFQNPHIIAAHRLDRLTSGALLLVTSRSGRGAYQQLFARGEVAKTYWAVTAPPTRPLPSALAQGEAAEIALPLSRRTSGLQIGVDTRGRLTNTRIQLRYRTKTAWWWQVAPLTGHQHQIRVVFSHLGMPILFDPLYPKVQPRYAATWQHGLALHAATLSFHDPHSGEQIRAAAPLPQRMRDIAGSSMITGGCTHAEQG